MTRALRFTRNLLALLLGLTLGMCGTAQIALAQLQPITQAHVMNPRMEWDTASTEVCVHGVARAGVAIITGYSITMDCERRIGVAVRMGNRQCIEHACQRLWRFTFDAGGVLMAWVNEWSRHGVLEARRKGGSIPRGMGGPSVHPVRRWLIAFNPLRWT